MSKIVPTISSGVAGSLGVLHLPRFWQKASLGAVGKLHDEYPACGAGFDQMTLNNLGLDIDATMAYINENKPSYCVFEAWVREHMNADADIAAHNDAVNGYIHDDGTRAEIFGTVNYSDDDCAFRDAVNLNNLDDWTIFHKEVIAGA